MKENEDKGKTDEEVTTAKVLVLLIAVVAGSIAALISIALFFEVITIESSTTKVLINATSFIGQGYYWLTIYRNRYSQLLEWISLICLLGAIVVLRFDPELRLTIGLIAIGLASQSAIPIVKRLTEKNEVLEANRKSSV